MNQSTVDRFWAKVRKGGPGDCWVWTASKRFKGYGAFVWADNEGKIIQGRAHRFSWEIHRGSIPRGLCVLHRCDNPACVRPDHLFLGTKADNNADMRQKGRAVAGGTYGKGKYRRGEDHHNAKLTEGAVNSVRMAVESGESYSSISARTGVGISQVCRIANHKAWAHLSPHCLAEASPPEDPRQVAMWEDGDAEA